MKNLLRLLKYAKAYRGKIVTASIFTVFNKIFDIMPEILIGVAVDTVVKQDQSFLTRFGFTSVADQLIFLGVLTFFIWVFESTTEYMALVRWKNLAQTLQHDFRMDVYAHVQNLDLAYFEDKSTGNLISILNDDVNQLERFFEEGAHQIIQVFFSSLIIGTVFFFIAPMVAVFAVLPIPFILIGAFYFQGKLAARFLEVRTKAGLLGGRLVNNISGIFTIKSFTSENFELEKIRQESRDYLQANSRAIRLSSMVTPIIRVAVLAGFLSTLMYGGFQTIHGKLAVGAFSVLVFLTQRLLWPLTRLADITVLYQRSMASAARILDLLQTPITISRHGAPVSKVQGNIVFDKVNFTYSSNHHRVLHDVSFSIKPGTTAAFVGTTGSGKTTLVKLLMRFYNADSGSISLDGKNIQTLDLLDLRQNMGLVSQDVFLFHGTVAENIAYARPNEPREKIIEAAKLAEAHEFIEKLPQGYDTVVGERGQKLSGGQRQRLAIARAILKNPPILILDEATSAVDNETELAIQKSLQKIVLGRTVLMVAHRLSTIRHADTIFVMEDGRIAELGTHEELVAKNGIYAMLWRLQTGEK